MLSKQKLIDMTKLISWVEIPTTDFYRAVDFYRQLLKIELKPHDFGSEKMACLPNNEGAIIQSPGFEPSTQGSIISFTSPDNLNQTLQKAEKAGGTIVKGKTKIEAEGRGYFALLLDTEGNRIGLYADN